HRRGEAMAVAESKRLAQHATDREAAIMHALDAEKIQGRGDVVGKRGHCVVARYGVAAAMSAHVEAQYPIAPAQQRRQLLGPHAAVGGERMREANNRCGIGTDEIVIDPAAIEMDVHIPRPPLLCRCRCWLTARRKAGTGQYIRSEGDATGTARPCTAAASGRGRTGWVGPGRDCMLRGQGSAGAGVDAGSPSRSGDTTILRSPCQTTTCAFR